MEFNNNYINNIWVVLIFGKSNLMYVGKHEQEKVFYLSEPKISYIPLNLDLSLEEKKYFLL